MSSEPKPSVSEPIGHQARVRSLWRAARNDRLPHALLLHGPPGVGKFLAARWLAQGLLCARGIATDAPCGECGACARVASGNHLDLLILDALERGRESIRIQWIARREGGRGEGGRGDGDDGPRDEDGHPSVEEFLGLRAAEGGWRVVIVREAERLAHSQNEAQNAMLKMLEEPGERVLWILETSAAERLLPTVLSRCVLVPFAGLDAEQCARVLRQAALEPELARTLARWAAGSPGVALALRARAALETRGLAVAALRGERPPLDGARELFELDGEFAGSTPTAKLRDRARTAIDLACAVVLDLSRAGHGVEAERLAHGDVAERLAREGRLPSGLAARRALDGLLVARADVDKNLDPQATVDRAWLELARLAPAPSTTAASR